MNLLKAKAFLEENNITYRENEPMHLHCSFKTGGNADIFVAVNSVEELKAVFNLCRTYSLPLTVLGNGSNLLISDRGIEGIVLSLAGLNKAEVSGNTLTLEAGVTLTRACISALENSLTGLEFAYGIPGSIGGAVYMNAGAYGGEIADVIVSATVLAENGEIIKIKRSDMSLGYRKSIFKEKGYIILSAKFCLNKGNSTEIKAKMDELMNRRRDKQPLQFPSAGSTFKRPEGHFAGALIEESGLKGKTVGGAMVSEKHAGFIINHNNATTDDILTLIDEVKKAVNEKFGIELEREIIFVGRK